MKKYLNCGFTIIELLMTLTVLGIITSYAIPSYTQFMTENRLSNQNTALMLDFALARGEAATRGTRVTVCQSNDGATCSNAGWGAGRIVFVDAGTAGSVDTNDEILKVSAAISTQDTLTADEADLFISYRATGVASQNITFTTCQTGYKGAKVTIYPSGRISKDSAGDCT